MLRRCALLLVIAFQLTIEAQSLSKRALAVRQEAAKLTPDAHVSVILVQGGEEFGRFVSSSETSFVYFDVDRKATVTIDYEQVKLLKKGYGGFSFLHQRHVDRRKETLTLVAIVGGLALVIGLAASTK